MCCQLGVAPIIEVRASLRASHIRISTPEENRQHDHEEGMRAQIRSECEVGVEGGRAQRLLQQGQVGCLHAYDWNEAVSQRIAPGRESLCIFVGVSASVRFPQVLFR
jgi:hypothetical protein